MGSTVSSENLQLSPDYTVIVTEGHFGDGYCISWKISRMSGKVIIACDSEEKANAAIKQMQNEHYEDKRAQNTPESQIQTLNLEYMHLDLASFESTLKFVEEYKAKGYRLDAIVCDASGAPGKHDTVDQATKDGFQYFFQTRYLSHLLLILNLLPIMKASTTWGRVVLNAPYPPQVFRWDEKDLEGKRWACSGVERLFIANLYLAMLIFSLGKRLKGLDIGILAVNKEKGTSEPTGTYEHPKYLTRQSYGDCLAPTKLAVDPKYASQTGVCFNWACRPRTAALDDITKDTDKQEQIWKFSMECLKDHINGEILKHLMSQT